MFGTEVYVDKARIARLLLDIGAVTLRPQELFTWTSGIKSPIYCDNRLLLSSVIARNEIIKAFIEVAQQYLPAVEGLAGTATAGIPHAAFLADRLGLPMVYVRSSAKSHGKQNQVEGRLLPGQRMAVLEDTISTGGSALSAVTALRELGVEVKQILSVYSYRFPEAESALQEAEVQLFTLTDYPTLIEVAHASGRIQADEVESLASFYRDPWAFGQED